MKKRKVMIIDSYDMKWLEDRINDIANYNIIDVKYQVTQGYNVPRMFSALVILEEL